MGLHKKYPKLIPYVTSYYEKNWGFCLEHEKRKKLKKGNYKVVINSAFKKGFVKNGLAKIKGSSNKIVLLSSYLCHPSMANNELSGVLALLGLYEKMEKCEKQKFMEKWRLGKYEYIEISGNLWKNEYWKMMEKYEKYGK